MPSAKHREACCSAGEHIEQLRMPACPHQLFQLRRSMLVQDVCAGGTSANNKNTSRGDSNTEFAHVARVGDGSHRLPASDR
jgi:hypothetical protein